MSVISKKLACKDILENNLIHSINKNKWYSFPLFFRKNELNIINDLLKKNGQLHTAVIDANKTLTVVAQDMGINVENILSNEKSENESQFNLRDIISSAAFQEKILACLNNMWSLLFLVNILYIYIYKLSYTKSRNKYQVHILFYLYLLFIIKALILSTNRTFVVYVQPGD